MVGVDGEVKPHELNELLVLSVTKKGGQVLGVIGVWVDGGHLAVSVNLNEEGEQFLRLVAVLSLLSTVDRLTFWKILPAMFGNLAIRSILSSN